MKIEVCGWIFAAVMVVQCYIVGGRGDWVWVVGCDNWLWCFV